MAVTDEMGTVNIFLFIYFYRLDYSNFHMKAIPMDS